MDENMNVTQPLSVITNKVYWINHNKPSALKNERLFERFYRKNRNGTGILIN